MEPRPKQKLDIDRIGNAAIMVRELFKRKYYDDECSPLLPVTTVIFSHYIDDPAFLILAVLLPRSVGKRFRIEKPKLFSLGRESRILKELFPEAKRLEKKLSYPPSLSELARFVGLPKPTVCDCVNRLEKEGILYTVRMGNRRKVLVSEDVTDFLLACKETSGSRQKQKH